MNLDQSIQETLALLVSPDKSPLSPVQHAMVEAAKKDLTRLFEEHSKERVRKTVRDIRQSGMGGFDSWEERFWAVIEKIDEVEDRFVA